MNAEMFFGGAPEASASAPGTCVRAGEVLLVCVVDGFGDDSNVDGVPVEAAAQFWSREPAYFHADLDFAGKRFTNVGLRYKGNNGLAQSRGEKKPLRIKLDEWEDDDVSITDQRLFGFQLLSLSPNTTDASNLHQVLAAQVFRDNGVPAPLAGFVEVTLDTGDGPRLIGLYAMTEVPDDPLLDRVFGNDNGNLYKPDGRGAHFASFHSRSFHKQNNDDAPLTDVRAFFTALHADQGDRAKWRDDLRAAFDVDGFAEFFAVNQTIGNWDTYGMLAHNFYLYGDPARGGQLRFIAWDFDLSFDGSAGFPFDIAIYDGTWPLLQAVARDDEFSRRYHEKLADVVAAELDTDVLADRVDALEALVRPAVVRENALRGDLDAPPPTGPALEAFEQGLTQLRAHVQTQQERADRYLSRVGLR